MTIRLRRLKTGIFLTASLLAGSPVVAGELLQATSDICVANGTNKNAVVDAVMSLGWTPVKPVNFSGNLRELYAVRFLANAAYKNEHSPTWEQAWNEGLLKADRHTDRGAKTSKFSSADLFTRDGDTALLFVESRTLPNWFLLSCYVVDSKYAFDNAATIPDAGAKRLDPAGVLSIVLAEQVKLGAFKVARTGIRLDADLVTASLGHPIPATAYVLTFVSGSPKD
ncbi:MAG: hypothetical protein WBC93_04680 [Sulfitobacter sp.]